MFGWESRSEARRPPEYRSGRIETLSDVAGLLGLVPPRPGIALEGIPKTKHLRDLTATGSITEMAAGRRDEELLRDLNSDVEAVVVSALHSACPCSGSSRQYERFMAILGRFKHDPRPRVRAVALHLEQDALEALAKDDERANGWVRNRPGGNGKRREARRAKVRYG